MATWANGTKATTTLTNGGKNLGRVSLLIESPFYLLIGDGFKLDIDNATATNYTNQSKSSSTFTNVTKN